jgi:hypothetical protein
MELVVYNPSENGKGQNRALSVAVNNSKPFAGFLFFLYRTRKIVPTALFLIPAFLFSYTLHTLAMLLLCLCHTAGRLSLNVAIGTQPAVKGRHRAASSGPLRHQPDGCLQGPGELINLALSQAKNHHLLALTVMTNGFSLPIFSILKTSNNGKTKRDH